MAPHVDPNHLDDLDILADALADVADLAHHPGWPSVRKAIEDRIAGLRLALSKTAQTATIEQVRFTQGRIAGLEELLRLPQRVIDRLAARTTRAVS